MKCVVFALLVFTVAMVQGQGIPIKKCPPGEHSVLYCPPMAEPDCEYTSVHELKVGLPCDIPQCFCDTPKLRNLKTGKCVHVTECYN